MQSDPTQSLSPVTGVRSVIIVGAGLAGATSAYVLARAGYSVRVFEASPAPGLETSFANGGMLTPSMPDPWNGPGVWRHLLSSLFDPSSSLMLRPRAIPSLLGWGPRFLLNARPQRFAASTRANFLLARYSTELTRRWRQEERLEFDCSDVGTIKFFRDRDAMAGPLAISHSLADLGLRFVVLGRPDVVALEPALAPIAGRIAGAIHFPDDLAGDAYKFTCAMAQRAREMRARFFYNAPVQAIATEGSRAIGVRSGGSFYHADAVVVAAANNSRRLLRRLGLGLPVRPAKGYSVTFDLVDGRSAPRHAVVDDAMHAAAVPLGARLRLAGTAEFTGEDLSISQPRVESLLRLLREIYPSIASSLDPTTARSWAGLRPMSADGRPFIGPTRIRGLFLNTGHGHLGWTFAAGSAEFLRSLIAGEKPALAPEPYSPTRF